METVEKPEPIARQEDDVPADVQVTRPSIWKLGGLKWHEMASRVWAEFWNGHLLVHAASLAFYFLFALFPFLIFLVNLMGFFVGRGSEMRAELLYYIGRVAPVSAYGVINHLLDEIATGSGGVKLLFGLIAAMWFGSLGVSGITESLNAMYGVRETRSWLRVRASAVGLTVAMLILSFTALLVLVYGRQAGEQISGMLGQASIFPLLWTIVQGPAAIAFMLLTFALVYYFAPDLYDQHWYWITPGSVAGVVIWLAASLLLSTYLRYADSYSVTYGSLGGIVILMLWFYITGASLLIGGKINAEIENAAARAGIAEAKLHGERAPDHHETEADDGGSV